MTALGAIDLRARPPVGPFLELALFDDADGLAVRLRSRGYEPPPSFLAKSIDLFFDEMAAAGIGAVVVGARAPGRLGGVSNAAAAEVVREHWPRVVGFIGAVSGELDALDDELAECQRLGAVGVAVESGLWDPPLHADSTQLWPIYERIQAVDLPVFVTGGDSGPDTSYASPLPLERASAAFPGLEFVAVHGGWPYVREMVAVALRRPNVWVMPDLYAARFPGHGDYVEAANTILRERMLFASSYPAVNVEQFVAALAEDGLLPDAWRAMAMDNPRRLLGDRFLGSSEPSNQPA
jgi:predicted TIM-barrel fold metal-dependent hydrolase